MLISTSDSKSIKPFIDKLHQPEKDSHKGQNGKILIVGGSSLFHSASIWAAEVASYFVDMVHYSSTEENNQVLLSLKKKFQGGMVIPQKNIFEYVREDDAILVGPGMLRGESEEAKYTKNLVYKLISEFPEKKFVFDAGALQMMEPEWLTKLQSPAIVTPQGKEFEKLFGIAILEKSKDEKVKIVQETAKKYKTVILLKTVFDTVSDGKDFFVIEGGNPGLTKGGTGDILAGLAVSFYSKNDPITSAVVASCVLKRTAEVLSLRQGNWYNINTVIEEIPKILFDLSQKNI
jgi:NAD(P)H-hydrate epimerase